MWVKLSASIVFVFCFFFHPTLSEMSQLIQIMLELQSFPAMKTNTTGFGVASMRSNHSAQYDVFNVSLFHPIEPIVCFSPFLVWAWCVWPSASLFTQPTKWATNHSLGAAWLYLPPSLLSPELFHNLSLLNTLAQIIRRPSFLSPYRLPHKRCSKEPCFCLAPASPQLPGIRKHCGSVSAETPLLNMRNSALYERRC